MQNNSIPFLSLTIPSFNRNNFVDEDDIQTSFADDSSIFNMGNDVSQTTSTDFSNETE